VYGVFDSFSQDIVEKTILRYNETRLVRLKNFKENYPF